MRSLRLGVPATLLLLAGACQRIDSGNDLVVGGLAVLGSRGLPHAVLADGSVDIGTNWMAYVADEAASARDLNGDGDADDPVAVVVELATNRTETLRAAREVFVIGDEVYLVTDEDADGRDWDGDALLDARVLLHWSRARDQVSFVAPLADARPVRSGERLFFTDARPVPPGLPGATRLHWLAPGAPRAPVRVLARGGDFSDDARPLGQDQGLLLLVQDEHPLRRDLNGDGDAIDESVLALVDATAVTPELFSVGLTLGDSGTEGPVRAARTASGDWLVGFLVDEATQGRANLNDPGGYPLGLLPPTCAGDADVDVEDRVLFGLFFRPWSADPARFPPFATGITGRERVLALEDRAGRRHVLAAVSHEADEGACSLNGDADRADRVLRWVEVDALGALGPVELARPIALDDTPGGAGGVAEVDGRFVAALSEAADGRDLDGRPAHEGVLTAWVDPFDALGAWSVVRRSGGGTLELDWLAEGPDRLGVLLGTLEAQIGAPCNQDDRDLDDTFAALARFDAADPRRFTWSARCYAARRGNAGLVTTATVAFLRADEADQNRDINEDGDRDDQVLVQHGLEAGSRLLFVGTLNDLPTPAVIVGRGDRAAFRVDERQRGRDLNGDGDALDLVLRTVPAR